MTNNKNDCVGKKRKKEKNDCVGQFIAMPKVAYITFAHILLSRTQSHGLNLTAVESGKCSFSEYLGKRKEIRVYICSLFYTHLK